MYLAGCTEDQCADGEHIQPRWHLPKPPSIKPFAAEGRGQELVLASAVAPEVVEERKQVLKSMEGFRL